MIGGLLDRMVLLGGVLLGGALPSFMQQYRQRLGGRLDQAREQLAAWQDLADRLHGGDLAALVAHHRASADATFLQEAQLIESVQAEVGALDAAVSAIQGGSWEQLAGMLAHLRAADMQATWSVFEPAFPMTMQGISFALLLGGTFWLLWVGAVGAARHLAARRLRARRRHMVS